MLGDEGFRSPLWELSVSDDLCRIREVALAAERFSALEGRD